MRAKADADELEPAQGTSADLDARRGPKARKRSAKRTRLLRSLLRVAVSNAENAIGDISDCAIDVETPH